MPSEKEYGQGSKAATGPTVTLEAIEANIVHEAYLNAGDAIVATGNRANQSHQLLTLCVLTLRNGFTIVGKSACAYAGNFNQEMGQKVARGDAIRQIWPLMGYELRGKLDRASSCGDELGEALTRMVAHQLGNSEAFRPQDVDQILGQFPKDNQEEGGQEDSFAVEHVTATGRTKNDNPFG